MGVPFVGRETELAAVLRDLQAGQGSVAITGAAGVGKSRLLTEATALLEAERWRVVSIVGYDAARKIPMGALASLLPDEPPDSEALLIASVLRSIVGESGDSRRTIVSVDDAQLLDNASLALVAEMIRAGECAVALAVTVPGELPRTLERLLMADGMARVDLEPMSSPEILALAAEHLGAPLAEPAGEQVVAGARGMPLILRGLLTDAVKGGAIKRVGDHYVLTGDLPAGNRVTDIIGSLIRGLPRELAVSLERLAVAEPVDFSILGIHDEDPRPHMVGELEKRDLARVDFVNGVWTIRTAHALIGEAVRAAMPTARRLEILAELCDLAARRPELSPHAAITATGWFTEYGTEMPAHIAAGAAWEALITLDVDTAVELATPAARRHWRAAYVLAETARWRGDADSAESWLAQAAALAPDDESVRRVAMTRSALEAWQRNDPESAIEVLRRAAEQVSDSALADQLLCEAGFLGTLLGEFDEAMLTARNLLAREDADPMSVGTAAINLCYSKVMLGDTEGLAEAIKGVQAAFNAASSDRPEGPDLVYALAVGEKILSADMDAAVSTATRVLEELRRVGSPRGVCAAQSSDALLHAADPRAAEVALEAVRQFRHHDPYNALPYGLGHAALMTALSGDTERAGELLAEVDEEGIDPRSRAIVGRAAAAVAGASDRDEAAELALDSGIAAIEANHISIGALAVFEAFSYAPPARVAPVLATACDGPTAPLLSRFHSIALGFLDQCYERVIGDAFALEDAGAPYLAAITLAGCARVDDDSLRARRAAARAATHTLRSGWLPMPVVDRDDALSAREAEIALAAADGLSNREIAQQAFLSTRTVENHLARVYAKLEVDGREQLGPVLGPCSRPATLADSSAAPLLISDDPEPERLGA